VYLGVNSYLIAKELSGSWEFFSAGDYSMVIGYDG
jgi:hypothetical protein